MSIFGKFEFRIVEFRKLIGESNEEFFGRITAVAATFHNSKNANVVDIGWPDSVTARLFIREVTQ